MIAGVNHVALRTDDVAALARFYTRALGLRRAATRRDAGGIRAIWLRAGETVVMLERQERGEPKIPHRSMEALVFTIAPRDRAKAVARLARSGVAIEGATDFSIYVRDPEGRRVGVSSYPETSAPQSATARASKTSEPRGRRGA